MTYIFTCRSCGERVEINCPLAQRPARKKCRCGRWATRDVAAEHGRPRNATTGEKRSAIAGCGAGEEAELNRDLAAAGIDAQYDPRNGDLVARDRRNFLKAIKARGMHSNTDGGFPL